MHCFPQVLVAKAKTIFGCRCHDDPETWAQRGLLQPDPLGDMPGLHADMDAQRFCETLYQLIIVLVSVRTAPLLLSRCGGQSCPCALAPLREWLIELGACGRRRAGDWLRGGLRARELPGNSVCGLLWRHRRVCNLCTRLGSFQRCVYCLLYTSPSPGDLSTSRMPSSA